MSFTCDVKLTRAVFGALVVALVVAAGCAASVAAQTPVVVTVEVRAGGEPLADATVTVGGATYQTPASGRIDANVTPGVVIIAVSRDGFVPFTRQVTAGASPPIPIVIELQPLGVEEDITVSATRTNQRLDDQPTRVEVLGREEIEEKLLMTPGDIVMMLNEMGGMRVQVTSPSLGAAAVRIQGMRGRYTRVFSDGLPLFGEVGGLGLLQIPPMDLGQVEVIKGVASSLYGAGAMGGVVNLISRRPGPRAERELLLNRSVLGGTDAVAWFSTPAREGWAMTLLTGGHFQARTDVDDDRWSDIPGYSRGVVRPRVFWDGGRGRSFFATAGYTAEDREGGGSPGGLTYEESLSTRRLDVGAVGQFVIRDSIVLTARVAHMRQRHRHQFGEVLERDRHSTTFGELTARQSVGRHLLVAGVAVEREAYRPADVPSARFTHVVPGIFIQDDVEVARWLSVSASARVDHHSVYGTFVSPRISGLLRVGGWTSRTSFGRGFFAPSALTEATEAAGVSRLVTPRPLNAERGRSVTMDIGRVVGPVSYSVTLFRSRVYDPVHVDRSSGLTMTNREEPSTNTGVELLGTLRAEPVSLTASYTFVRSRELDDDGVRDAPLTPAHSAGVVGMWERENAGRLGVELYYTGRQRLEENPFADRSQPYLIVGVLAERQFGRLRLFINGENLTGVRQSRWDPLVRSSRAADGRWTVDAWAPLEGRNVNGGFRLNF